MFIPITENSPVMNVLSALADLSFIVYIPFVLLELRQANKAESYERARQREARKSEIYTQLIQGYIDWQKLCLEFIELDIADYPDEKRRDLTPIQAKQEQIALGILIELFEQAFLAYLDSPADLRAYQWKGWDLYIDDYCAKPNFRNVWMLSRPNMDVRFSEFMEAKMRRNQSGSLPG